jgi:hypothetical protein
MKDKTKKINLICERRLERYFSITEKALRIAGKSINPEKQQEAKEILEMVSCYLSDAKYFQKQGHYVNSFAAINYAHGWLDSGSRLGIFLVKDKKLFVVK